jgi:thiamine pyrophosphokinase
MKSALVIGDGEISLALTEDLISCFDLTVALDGAFNKLPSGIEVDYVCGDLDSLDLPNHRNLIGGSSTKRISARSKTEIVELPSQDANDLEKTLLWLQERGIGRLVLVNLWGGRIDQTLASLSVVISYHKDLEIVLYVGSTAIRVLSEGQHSTIATQPGDGISLTVVSGSSRLSLAGVQWPLQSEELFPGSRGVSNNATGESVTLNVESGVVIFTHTASDNKVEFRRV